MYFRLKKSCLAADADFELRKFEVVVSCVCKRSSFDLKGGGGGGGNVGTHL